MNNLRPFSFCISLYPRGRRPLSIRDFPMSSTTNSLVFTAISLNVEDDIPMTAARPDETESETKLCTRKNREPCRHGSSHTLARDLYADAWVFFGRRRQRHRSLRPSQETSRHLRMRRASRAPPTAFLHYSSYTSLCCFRWHSNHYPDYSFRRTIAMTISDCKPVHTHPRRFSRLSIHSSETGILPR